MLTERQKMILSAIVNDYIHSAEPIGSRSISKRNDVGFSPATIRNEMSDLEEMGFLEQPHTSAGRIPSHKGYRYFVDHLINVSKTKNQEISSIKNFFKKRLDRTEENLQEVASILSDMTQYTSIALGPELFNTTLKHLQFISINDDTGVVIIVTDTGQVENKKVHIPEGISITDIEKCINILNSRLRGEPIISLKQKLFNELGNELKKYVSQHHELMQMLDDVFDTSKQERIYMSGTTNMLTQPEFKDVSTVKNILDLINETQTWINLFSNAPKGIQVTIGTENNAKQIQDCSLITATYKIEGHSIGTIGILGPTRMEYERVINLLNHLTDDLVKFYYR
ncbi:heat-inducible transcriptional repressor HrcA [Chengkuizengella axinellae]|uniref:Heat-inducible transcription repressor HrcA n=1 Tax=Chengkuizengella axinellae TaxID=3064388 RepID=A0ABT9IUM7_9BACL|nr:heat-inducible transcriptional repressor HrcA [Chengkuizengella sp. 2205SS18-9]MDP5273064.1 heat-inducible transcriptional repressor HrcA [Chengkuizengella sp. 2205SS18-9]